MPFTLAADGDLLESTYAEFIEERLPGYRLVWSEYIGNNGNSKLPKLVDMDDTASNNRDFHSQYQYSCLESVICMKIIIEKFNALNIGNLSNPHQQENYLDAVNLFVAFYAHIGRVRDLIKKIGELWNQGSLFLPLNEYYKKRNNVLHESKLPGWLICGVLYILPPEGEKNDANKWGSNRKWNNADPDFCEPATEHLAEVFEEIAQLVNNAFCKLYAESIKPYLKKSNIVLLSSNNLRAKTILWPSGVYSMDDVD